MPSPFARQLRQNLTEAEKHLWARLRQKQLDGHRFRRQAPLGRFVVDFVCFESRLVVELDGGQHGDQSEADELRTRWLEAEGFTVIRFWSNEVLENTEGVLASIVWALRQQKK
ncbi:MAG: DUF559 domain-containing protein [Alphaproteobacteria bacterium]|jgi:very-short-patch-repair endonuclease|nr:DNA (cytosine-5-)-methyltransferase [Rhodospirillaceae bacterium]MDP6406206.1 DUF559 domain-containing protein [Alphaproteobacteria bacterium]MDP6621583.1 DUF559 domain-containing protein [Alphaproteobacteria bacterium]